jgi:predicted transcriptional regulator
MMNKQAMISIHPEHAYNILIGKKTLEIRKSMPKEVR